MEEIELNLAVDARVEGAEVISCDHFGAVETGFTRATAFFPAFEEVGFSHLRWPGGYLSEALENVYGLDVPGIFDGTQLYAPDPYRVRPDLADTLSYCVENNISFAMLIPTVRYANDVELGVKDLRDFLVDLLAGEYGDIPSEMTLEIGNEYYAHDVFANDPAKYGQVANAFISVVHDVLQDASVNPRGLDLGIAIQLGRSQGDDEEIRSQISQENLVEIDAVVAHTLPLNFSAIGKPEDDPSAHPEDFGDTRIENIGDYLDNWQSSASAVLGSSFDIDLYISEMNIGAGVTDPDEVNLQYQDYGLRAASGYLELFAENLAIGMDSGAFWGVSAGQLNAIVSKDAVGTLDKPAGELLRLMAENLIGMEIVDGFQSNSREDLIMTYAFEKDDSYVLFVVANDIDPAGQSVSIDISTQFLDDPVEAVRLSAVIDEDYGSNADDLSAMLYERPVVDTFEVAVQEDSVSLQMTQDYEVVMLRFAKEIASVAEASSELDQTIIIGTDGDDTLSGAAADETVQAGQGNDILFGRYGDDQLFGGSGHDRLEGGQGNDRLFGNAGRDVLLGGDDRDVLLGGAGNDRLLGEDGNDVLKGGTDNDVLIGGEGRDRLYGEEGNDVLLGSEGEDSLYGGEGQDRLVGGGGADLLSGGQGDDLLSGGFGADLFIFGTGFGDDVIADFETGLDRIDLSGFAHFSSIDELLSNGAQQGDHVVFDLDGHSLTLENLDYANLTVDDFIL